MEVIAHSVCGNLSLVATNELEDAQNRINELEADVSNYQEREEGSQRCIEDLGEQLAQEKAEADLFHAAYVGMCTMHPNRALTIGHSQQEH